MPIQTIINETKALLADTDVRMAKAELDLATGDSGKKVEAAGQLTLLKRHRDEILTRLAELEASPGGAVATIIERLKEEGMLLRQSLENLTVHH